MDRGLDIDWAVWDSGPASSLSQWLSVRCINAQLIAQHYGIARGVAIHIVEIDATIPAEWTDAVLINSLVGGPSFGVILLTLSCSPSSYTMIGLSSYLHIF